MNIALIGYGKMGRLLAQKAPEWKHRIVTTVDPLADDALCKHLSEVDYSAIDCALEFTGPATAVENINILAAAKVPVVVGSTGWHSRMDEVQKLINDSGSSLLWASNFSLGINLFYRIAAFVAAAVDPFTEYDLAGFEIHHNKKLDSPSGTAKTLAERILAAMPRKTSVVWDKLDRPPEPHELHFASLRAGAVPGTHGIIVDSQSDTIEIRHTARNREGFAAGAFLAAQWLVAEKRSGVFTMEDFLC
ncbi:MAG: 4-hydroxy-tetrahydrodipicolinate reductase [Spirochaetaceae bacterium]|jgi:4-hydroxy-tetrahydrodipicolinate reductase|nr:4-hydroxy-tetrahydrodipicolinate reductase [Spirochaetaceae bacterium]